MRNQFTMQIKDLSHTYNEHTIFEKVNWTLSSGSIYVLLGENGAGKTTLLNIIANMLTSTSGEILFFDELNTEREISYKNDLGYLTEYPYLYPFMTPIEMIDIVGSLKGVDEDALKDMTDKWFTVFDLHKYKDKIIDELSQGTKRRLAFVISILHSPKILLLDEPTNGLDPKQILKFQEAIIAIAKNGTLVLLSTHILDLAYKLADEIGILSQKAIYSSKEIKDIETLYFRD